MTPEAINAAIPLGQPMTILQMSKRLGDEPTRNLARYLQRFPQCFTSKSKGGGRREWTRISDMPTRREPRFPCEVRRIEMEIPLDTKSAGYRTVTVSLPREPWVTA
jgi:hypothetical protein